MTTDDHTTSPARGTFTLVLIGAVLVSFAFVTWVSLSNSTLNDPQSGLAVGSPAPELLADVWVQGEAPDPADLEGEVYVVVAWATWCLPCYYEAPHLVEVHEKFEAKHVRFFGLTAASPQAESDVAKWLRDTGITWPNGFGMQAATTLEQYQADYIPAVWVIGRDGKVWWNRGMCERESLEDALRRTLDESRMVAETSPAS